MRAWRAAGGIVATVAATAILASPGVRGAMLGAFSYTFARSVRYEGRTDAALTDVQRCCGWPVRAVVVLTTVAIVGASMCSSPSGSSAQLVRAHRRAVAAVRLGPAARCRRARGLGSQQAFR